MNNRSFHSKAFACPHCTAIAEQTWSDSIVCGFTYRAPSGAMTESRFYLDNTSVSKCSVCNKFSLWVTNVGTMFYPITISSVLPNDDMPDDIKDIFNEARNIADLSPKGAAALLRLALQKLCIHLGEKGQDLNTDIGNLVKKGLPQALQQALDGVRVTGNNAVHPGVLNIDDNPQIVHALFEFINLICMSLITQPKKIAEYYSLLPEGSRKAIEKRDGNSTK